ncbi:DUF2939 domain-containing protein [Leptospira sp. SA-E8]|uniref:DUF2939 domain-containing protein n=1 Tax=Leptospira sp. SA-E8 TaxID=3422259 RepID=UPI003EC0A7D6
MSKKVAIWVCVIGVLGIAGYVAAGPYITVHQMKAAAEARDGRALSEHIEFPSVRQSLKEQMNALIMKKMAEDQSLKKNPFAALGAAFAGTIAERMVDLYVTPAGITQLMAGEKPQMQKMNAESASSPRLLSGADMSYESFDKFVVKINGQSGNAGEFVLRRTGLDWKLTEIILPLE